MLCAALFTVACDEEAMHDRAMSRAGRPPMTPLSPFGMRLREAIENAFPTRHAFMIAAELYNSTLRTFETGVQSPRICDVEKWAGLLHVSAGWLAFGVEMPTTGRVEQDENVAWAADAVGLDEPSTRRLQQVRALCGPMSRSALFAVADAIAANGRAGIISD